MSSPGSVPAGGHRPVAHATVLGSGIVGLTTAYRLLQAGWQVDLVAAAAVESSTSYLAAAVWFPTHVGPPERVGDWGRQTYAVLEDQARAGVPGTLMRETLVLGRSPLGRPDWVDAVGEVRPASSDELPPGYPYGLRFAVPLVEMPVYLPWLVAQVELLGARTVRRRVDSLQELAGSTDVVVNCSGLAAREIVGDQSVHPVRGQVVRVTNPGLTMSVRDEHHPGGRAYVHPRRTDCILGGTLEVDRWDTAVDPAEADAILARCRDIVPALEGATVLEHVVGLRPARPTVRLEESAPLQGSRVVHNYGHGGSGVTVGWGCADEVVRLLAPAAS